MNEKFGVIFDLDGTLIDSFEQIFKTLELTSTNLTFGSFDKELCYENFGLPLANLIALNGVKHHQIEEFMSEFRTLLENQIRIKNKLFDGVYELLTTLNKLKIPIGIATNKPQYLANLVYEHSELSHFNIFVKGTDPNPPKPNPKILLEILMEMKVQSGIMIGDSIEDFLAAKSANLSFIGVTTNLKLRESIILNGAIDCFAEIIEVQKSLVDFLNLS